MKEIRLEYAVSGMVISRDVFQSGTSRIPVCARGTVLSDKLITRLKKLDIPALFVDDPSEMEASTPEQKLQALEYRFEKVKDDPLTAVLYEIHKDGLCSQGDGGGREE